MTEAAQQQQEPMNDLDALTADRDHWQQQATMYAAELENVRKRAEKEVKDAYKYAVTKFAEELLKVQDNMERAFDAARGGRSEAANQKGGEDPQVKALMDGIDMVANQMNAALGAMQIDRLDIVPGETKFDPEHHQVMMEQADTGKEAGTITQELQAGYTIAGRLLRPSLVAVARKN